MLTLTGITLVEKTPSVNTGMVHRASSDHIKVGIDTPLYERFDNLNRDISTLACPDATNVQELAAIPVASREGLLSGRGGVDV